MKSKRERNDDCPACGYPMKVVKEIAGSMRQAKKIKLKCTGYDCTYTEIAKSERENYNESRIVLEDSNGTEDL